MSEKVLKRQNRCLNCEKGIACLLVIVLHCEFPTYIGSMINVVARIGVPLFFLISGFFLYSTDCNKVSTRVPMKIKKTFYLVLIYYAINVFYELIVNCILSREQTILQMLAELFSVNNLLDAIIWNRTIVGIGGWFLPALLFCYVIIWFVNQYNAYKHAYRMIIPLFILYFIVSRGTSLPVWYSRNYLFDGLPFLLTGHYLAYKQEEIKQINNLKLVLFFMAGGVLACLERFTGGWDLYIGIIIMAIVVFVFAINNEEYTLGGIIEYTGEKLYLYCYLLHPFVIYMFIGIGNKFGLSNMVWFLWLRPFGVIFLTLAIAYMCQMIIYTLKGEKSETERK